MDQKRDMSKYKSPWSVAQRKPVPITSDDPRITTLQKYTSRIGSEVTVVESSSNNIISLDPIPEKQYNYWGMSPNINTFSYAKHDGTNINLVTDDTNIFYKVDNYGNVIGITSSQIGTPVPTNSFTIDSSANCYIVYAYNTDTLGMGNLIPSLIAKYDIDGNLLWTRNIPSAINATIVKTLTDSGQNLYIFANSLSGNVSYIIKLTSSGSVSYKKYINTTNTTTFIINDAAIDSTDNIYLIGYTSEGGNKHRILKINSSGSIVWEKKITGSYYSTYEDNVKIYISPSDDIYVSSTAPSLVNNNFYQILKVTTSGSLTQGYTFRISNLNNNSQIPLAITFDGSGNIYISGNFTNIASASMSFIIKHNSSMTKIWERTFYAGSAPQSSSQSIHWFNNDLLFCGNAYISLTKIPDDGTLIGKYNDFWYMNTSYIVSESSWGVPTLTTPSVTAVLHTLGATMTEDLGTFGDIGFIRANSTYNIFQQPAVFNGIE